MLRLLLNEYGIYDVDTLADNVGGIQGDTLAAWLRSDDVRARAAAYGGAAAADSTVDAGTLTVDDESVVEVAVAEAMITEAFQIADEHVAREVAARHTAEERALHEAAARQATEQTAVAVDTADANTCHYLVIGIGLAHGSSQTEPEPEQPHQPEPPMSEPHGHGVRCEWREPRRASHVHQPEPNELQTEPVYEEPPPVFADCSHYHAVPMTSRRSGAERRRARVSEW